MVIQNGIDTTDEADAAGEMVETSGHHLRTIVKHLAEVIRTSLQDLGLTEARQVP